MVDDDVQRTLERKAMEFATAAQPFRPRPNKEPLPVEASIKISADAQGLGGVFIERRGK